MEQALVAGIIAIALAMYLIGIITGKMLNKKKGEVCSVHVTSQNTGIKYHASRYEITKDDEINLMIYNHVAGRYEWYPIWHFDNPFIIAYTLDSNYAMNHWFKYMIGAEKSKELTKDTKK